MMKFALRFWLRGEIFFRFVLVSLALSSCRINEPVEVARPAASGRVEGELQALPPGYESGEMSWYTQKTNGGSTTASGEPLRDGVKTAAHRTLPFGTEVEVVNTLNQQTSVVRITDRGPHVDGRIIDVSMAAAKELGFVERGVAPCRIRVLP